MSHLCSSPENEQSYFTPTPVGSKPLRVPVFRAYILKYYYTLLTMAVDSNTSTHNPNEGDPAISRPTLQPSMWDPDTDRERRARTTQSSSRTRTSSLSPAIQYIPPSLYPGEPRSQSGISLRAFLLGITLGASAALSCYFAFVQEARIWRSFVYLTALSLFHFLEFWTHARYNLPEATVGTFLLSTNGLAYNIANGTALLETTLTSLFFQRWQARWSSDIAIGVGLVLIIIGQLTRSTAMSQAGTNFNHHVQRRKRDDHVLVTRGVYAYLRHPSYFGFYYWAVGTQMVTGNLFSGIAVGFLLWVFFNRRIRSKSLRLPWYFGNTPYTNDPYYRRRGVLDRFLWRRLYSVQGQNQNLFTTHGRKDIATYKSFPKRWSASRKVQLASCMRSFNKHFVRAFDSAWRYPLNQCVAKRSQDLTVNIIQKIIELREYAGLA